MQRVLDWIRKKGDHNIVQYSRFGLPGEETDDRPAPTSVHVAPFDDNDKKYMIFGMHSQKAAVISAGVGMCAVIFVFLSVFFEFDWYHHRKGVDLSALFGLVMYLLIGVMVHWYVIRGIKLMQPKFLVPFIIIYGFLLVTQFIFIIFTVNHWIALSYVETISTREPGAILLLMATFAVVMLCQGGMMFSVVRCRNYLEMKAIHNLELRVVEKCKQQFPGIRVVYGNASPAAPNVGIASQTVGESNSFPNPVNVENGQVTPPPSYGDTTPATVPQRTILQGREEV